MCQAGQEKTKDTYGCNERGREVSRCEDAADESEMSEGSGPNKQAEKLAFFFFFLEVNANCLLVLKRITTVP